MYGVGDRSLGGDILNTQFLEPFLDHITQFLMVHRHYVIPTVNKRDAFFWIDLFQVARHYKIVSMG